MDIDNLKNLKKALLYLKAGQIFLPDLEIDYLRRGHACHFRCGLGELKGFRIDIMAKLRGCDTFNDLWKRRKTVNIGNHTIVDLISLEDLVRCKKTQRDKDWIMLKRLVEIDILNTKTKPDIDKTKWWFYECRTVDLLIDLSKRYPNMAKKCIDKRPLLIYAIKKETDKLDVLLKEEEWKERELDRVYWLPLRKELEQLRRKRKK